MNIVDMRVNLRDMVSKRDADKAKAAEILSRAQAENRDMSPEESSLFEEMASGVQSLNDGIGRLTAAIEKMQSLEGAEVEAPAPAERSKPQAYPFPNISVGMASKEHRFDVCRALRSYNEGKRLNGFEGECHEEIARSKSTVQGGFFMPLNQKLANFRADFTTTAGAGAVVTRVAETPIEYLRNKLVFSKAGAQILDGLPPGNLQIPRQSGTATASWVTEGNSASATAADMSGSLSLVPQTLTAYTNVTRLMLSKSGVPSIDKMIQNDLLGSTTNMLDNTGVVGDGSSKPYGVLNDSNIPTVAIGTNGGPMTYDHCLALEKSVAEANAENGKISFVTSPAGRSKLKGTVKVSGQPVYLWSDDNQIVGYDAFASTQVPKNLTKGTASGTCTAVIYGNFEDYIIALWGNGIEIVEDRFSLSTSGGTRYVCLVDAAMGARHGGSLAKIVDFVYA